MYFCTSHFLFFELGKLGEKNFQGKHVFAFKP
jgi:hypothetical protein